MKRKSPKGFLLIAAATRRPSSWLAGWIDDGIGLPDRTPSFPPSLFLTLSRIHNGVLTVLGSTMSAKVRISNQS